MFFLSHAALKNTYVAMAMLIFFALPGTKITATYTAQYT
ncbi:hypothetical protein C900_02055 [Fulvivirga imtechensis AK7]|uniref:Uncharacterized protein n=1 Tax=Fulvivirga imtechensis AK7 TaxID=1237149 RepID=L8JU43_9BACT|nr:hypothetical protein C900_00305 [Fulvivirga imtechensis AK7]ELR71074.1 hypothetical protein C900_03038 [Fulvivirga imtechensis AK7]ELR71420.1 hypothetical protein C900_02761 [Fulvivirga imtechensis AK7]ELR71531.1 hypothetical protein C900_02594 [Fulvivirga imtechensis AK7]ELR73036.1 hypothetical protein C900_00116 [Fulvivirga imtechensis AK7]